MYFIYLEMYNSVRDCSIERKNNMKQDIRKRKDINDNDYRNRIHSIEND